MENHTLTRVPPLAQARGLITLLRVKQWVKNGFVLAPLIFSGSFLNSPALFAALTAFALFSLASSMVYIVNDIQDKEADKLHPKKRNTRPLASEQVSVRLALVWLSGLAGVMIWGIWHLPAMAPSILAYFCLNAAYTFFLKNKPVLDIFTIALGFVVRVYAGATVLGVATSGWMLITTLCLALYLAAIKRRQELLQVGVDSRKVLKNYSVTLVDRYAEMSATCALIFYSLFVLSARPELWITVPLVLFGVFRYWYAVEQCDLGGSPTDALFADKLLFCTVLLWVGVCMVTLWPTAHLAG